MLSLFRNPLFSLLRRLWWLSVLIPAAAWGLGGMEGLWLAVQFMAAGLGLLIGAATVALEHGAYVTLRDVLRRFISGYRFLCPRCLHFAHFRFACGACGNEVEAFLVGTGGAYVNECAACHEPLFSYSVIKGRGVRAYCDNCFGNCDRDVYHQRRVSVLATLLPADFESFGRLPGAQRNQSKDNVSFVCLDDGERLNYLLDYGNLPGGIASVYSSNYVMTAHALKHLEAVWLDVAGLEPLQLGRTIDAFIRQSESAGSGRSEILVCVRQTSPDPVIKSRLEAQFKRVRYGLEPADFLSLEVAAELEESRSQLSETILTLNLNSAATLAAQAQPVKQPLGERPIPAKLVD